MKRLKTLISQFAALCLFVTYGVGNINCQNVVTELTLITEVVTDKFIEETRGSLYHNDSEMRVVQMPSNLNFTDIKRISVKLLDYYNGFDEESPWVEKNDSFHTRWKYFDNKKILILVWYPSQRHLVLSTVYK